MKLLLKTLPLLVGFGAGFLVHALVFPDVLSNGITVIPDVESQNQPQEENHSIFTDITFDGKGFNRTNVTLRISDYLTITNITTDASMELVSNEKGLSTPRPYRESEQVKMRMNNPGTYYVQEVETGAKLAVTVR